MAVVFKARLSIKVAVLARARVEGPGVLLYEVEKAGPETGGGAKKRSGQDPEINGK